jgi:hypothetical protein
LTSADTARCAKHSVRSPLEAKASTCT